MSDSEGSPERRRDRDRRVGSTVGPKSRLRVLVLEDNRLMRDGLTRLLAEYPDVEIVDTDDGGAKGFIMKDATAGDIVKAMRSVASESGPAAARGAVRLTKREQEIRELILAGLGNKEIARRLNIATNTVKSHVHNMLGKLAAVLPPDRRKAHRSRRGASRRSYRFTRG